MQEPESKPYPKAVFFIIGNEFCERFSYYGMRTILTLFLINVLMFEEHTAKSVYHGFVMACYFSPVLGAMIADSYLGKFRTIFYISIVYANREHHSCRVCSACSCGPHLDSNDWPSSHRFWNRWHQAMCVCLWRRPVSARAGETVGAVLLAFLPLHQRWKLAVDIHNTNSASATMFGTDVLLPAGLRCSGGSDGAGTGLSHPLFEHLTSLAPVQPRSLIADIKDVLHVLVLYVPLPVFWALFDQQGSQWTLQANKMDGEILGYQVLPDQMQLVNPLLILVLVPVFSYGVYPMFNRCNLLNRPLQKITVGGLAAAAAFAVAGCLDLALESGAEASPPAGFEKLTFVNTLPCPVQVSGSELELRLPPGMALNEPQVQARDTLNVLAAPPCNLTAAQLQATTSAQVILLESSEQAVLPVLVPSGKSPNSHNSQLLVAYTLQEPVAAVVFVGDSPGKVYSVAPVHPNAASSFTNATGLPPGRYTTRLLGSGNKEVAVCDVVLKNGGHYSLAVTQQGASSTETNCTLHETVRPNSVSMFYQIPQYVLITAGEVMFSVTGLEFSYSQAPSSMKSVLQAAWLLTVAVGNLIVVIIAEARFFSVASSESFMYSGLMTLDMLVFGVMACFYKYIEPASVHPCTEKAPPVSEGDTKM
ncbi:hypothetical protein MRX96_005489 [Rhipicephalus microplus]